MVWLARLIHIYATAYKVHLEISDESDTKIRYKIYQKPCLGKKNLSEWNAIQKKKDVGILVHRVSVEFHHSRWKKGTSFFFSFSVQIMLSNGNNSGASSNYFVTKLCDEFSWKMIRLAFSMTCYLFFISYFHETNANMSYKRTKVHIRSNHISLFLHYNRSERNTQIHN